MEKQRKSQIIIIMALIVSIVGMSIGFAVFSDVLTISSSATVTPNEDDFKIIVYGVTSAEEFNSISSGNELNFTNWSTTTAKQFDLSSDTVVFNADTTFNATIDNANLKISNVSALFNEPGEEAYYMFILKNDGAYDAYVSLDYSFAVKSCIPGDGTNISLAESACGSLLLNLEGIFDSNMQIIASSLFTDSYKLLVDDYIILLVGIDYEGSNRADGPFTALFHDVEFNFSTIPPTTD